MQAGPAALYLEVDAEPSPELSRILGAWQRALREDRLPGVHEVIPAYRSLLIEYSAKLSGKAVVAWAVERARGSAELWSEAGSVAGSVAGPEATLGEIDGSGERPSGVRTRTHVLTVDYGRAADRAELEARLGLPFEEIVARHASTEFTVAFLGFTAGFPYLLGLPPELHTPRRVRPRDDTPAGAVAIAAGQAGIYPSKSPGGWWVLGVTDAVLFDPSREPPPLLSAGDAVRFVDGPIDRTDRPDRPDREDMPTPGPADPGSTATLEAKPEAGPEAGRIEILEAWPRSVSLQAAPRRGVGHWGMAEAGALDPRAFEEVNAIVGNPRETVALEAIGQPVRLRASASTRAALTGGGLSARLDGVPLARWSSFTWSAGAVLELVPDPQATGFTTYLAVAGGFGAQVFCGSASTDARAGVGGARRYLRTGDLLATTSATSATAGQPYVGTPRYAKRIVLRVFPGPQAEPGAWRRLLESSFRVRALDRTGARLHGPAVSLRDHETVSEGSPAGAVQVPPDGQPIILLADRGRTGGYAKPAVVHPRDLWRLAQARPGTEVWFEGAAEPDFTDEPLH